MIGCDLRESDATKLRNAAHPPHVQALGRQVEMIRDLCRADGVDEVAMGASVRSHNVDNTRSVDLGKHGSLIAFNFLMGASERMKEMAERMRARAKALGLSQKTAAELVGISPQRMGNYMQGTRTPDFPTLVRISGALKTSSDWLLGISSIVEQTYEPVILRLLELEGLPADRAEVIASTAQEAVRLLLALPPEGDDLTRSRMAAQAAWQSKGAARPN